MTNLTGYVMDKVRLGIIGLGRWPREVHIPNLNNIPEAEIVAVCDQNKENVEKAVEKVSSARPRTYNDYNELLKDKDVDAVMVCVPNYLHTKFAVSGLEAGKHVFCEKPLAITIEDHKVAQGIAKAKKKILQIGYELRYAKLMREIKSLIASKAIGVVNTMNINIYRGPVLSQWRLDDSKTGGLLLELCSHYFDLFSWYSESKVQSIFALSGSRKSGEQYDRVSVSLKFENDILATLNMVLFADFQDEVVIEVIGSDGILNARITSNEIKLFTRSEGKEKVLHIQQENALPEFGFMGARVEFEEFIRNIKTNSTPLTNADNSLESLLMAKAAERSLQTGKLELV